LNAKLKQKMPNSSQKCQAYAKNAKFTPKITNIRQKSRQKC